MSPQVEHTVVTFLGRTPEPVEPATAVEIFRHLDEYDPPATYPNRVSTVDSLDADTVDRARLMFGDHVPSEFDVRSEPPHLFHASYADGRVHVTFRTTLESLDDFLSLIEHCLEVTDLQVGGSDHHRDSFDVQFHTDSLVDVDDVEVPTGWMVRTEHDEDAGRSLLGFTLLDTPVLTDSTEPIATVLEDLRTVRATLARPPAAVPDCSSPAALVEDFYSIDDNPNLTTQQQLQEFIRDLAHSAGLFAKLEEVDQKTEATVLDMAVTVVAERLDEDAIEAWMDDHLQLRSFLPDDAPATIARGDVAVVEVELHLAVDGEEETQVHEHLLATEDGAWKLVR